MIQFPIIRGHWNDPDAPDKFRAFFLETYRANRAEQRARAFGAAPRDAAADGGEPLFHLGLDNLPEEHLSSEQFTYLVHVRRDVRRWLETPLEDTDDPLVAGVVLTRLCLFRATLWMVEHLLMYLMLDSRFHPDRAIRAKAIGIFTYEGGLAENWRLVLDALTGSLAGCRLLADDSTGRTLLLDEMRLLHLVGDDFFDTLQSIFPIAAVNKCRKAFTLLMKDLGTPLACSQVENYIRRRKTLYREIVAYEANGGTVGNVAAKPDVGEQLAALSAKIDANTAATTEVTKTVANMDRRQRTLFSFIKKMLDGFIRLFRPGAPVPTRGVVAEALLPSDRYAAIANYGEPRRSQLKAVIDMTYVHPIVRQEGKRGVFTLAGAALAVWDREYLKWKRIPGSFNNYEQLKAACYALAKDPKTNPFNYAQ